MTSSEPRTDTLARTGDRSVLRMERRYPHAAERVWAALTEPALAGQWFPCAVEAELREGGTITFRFDGLAGAMRGTVTRVETGRVFAFRWGEDHLNWEITPGDGTLLSLTQTFDDHYGAASFAAGWHLCLTGLHRVLDGGPNDVGPDAGDLHEAYAEQFGLNRGTAEPGLVRFERQLVRPAAQVWAVLTEGGPEPVAGRRAPRGFSSGATPPGPVTEALAPHLLAYGTDGGHEVRWQLGEGTGRGARLVLTQTFPVGFVVEEVMEAWHARLDHLVARLLES